MLEYSIFDSTANLVDSFDDKGEARAALEAIAQREPEHADEYVLITYDDGHVVPPALTAAELTHA
jgi:hypothetical protein